MLSKRDLRRAVRHGERELRAAGGDMLGQLRPRNILRDARDLVLKFMRDDVVQAYIGPRIWKILAVVLVFVLVSTVCSIDMMFRVARLVSDSLLLKALVLPFGAAVWLGGTIGQMYVFAISLEGWAAQRNREERGISVEMPEGVLAYLKYSRALVPWIAVAVFVLLPLLVMGRYVPVIALGLCVAGIGAPVLFRKLDR
jgi:hypothetical protein